MANVQMREILMFRTDGVAKIKHVIYNTYVYVDYRQVDAEGAHIVKEGNAQNEISDERTPHTPHSAYKKYTYLAKFKA